MERKQLIWVGMIVGSTVGGFVPLLWGSSELSMSAIVLSAVGAIAGIWAAFKASS